MNGLSSLNNVLVHGSQAPVFVDARSSLDLLSRTQGLGMSQELPPERDSFPFQPTISQEQRWDVAYFPKGDHVVVSGGRCFFATQCLSWTRSMPAVGAALAGRQSFDVRRPVGGSLR
jgi:hypothetical protein